MEAGSTIDTAFAGILVSCEVDSIWGVDRGVGIKVVVGPKDKAYAIANCHSVGDVLCVWHM